MSRTEWTIDNTMRGLAYVITTRMEFDPCKINDFEDALLWAMGEKVSVTQLLSDYAPQIGVARIRQRIKRIIAVFKYHHRNKGLGSETDYQKFVNKEISSIALAVEGVKFRYIISALVIYGYCLRITDDPIKVKFGTRLEDLVNVLATNKLGQTRGTIDRVLFHELLTDRGPIDLC